MCNLREHSFNLRLKLYWPVPIVPDVIAGSRQGWVESIEFAYLLHNKFASSDF